MSTTPSRPGVPDRQPDSTFTEDPGGFPQKVGNLVGAVNMGPFVVAPTNQGVATPGPAVPVPRGSIVRVLSPVTNTAGKTVSVQKSRDSNPYPLGPNDEVTFPAENLSRVFVTISAPGDVAVFTIKQPGQ